MIEDYVLDKFINVFRTKIEAIVDQRIEEEFGLDRKEIKEIGNIFNVISGDYNSNMTIEAHVGDKITKNYQLDGIKANAIQRECLRMSSVSKEDAAEVFERCVLHWKSAGEDDKSLSIDQGIIEEVDPKLKVKLICDEHLKKQMISENQNNPFNMFFIVDVEVKRIRGKPIAYVITKIHESGSIS